MGAGRGEGGGYLAAVDARVRLSMVFDYAVKVKLVVDVRVDRGTLGVVDVVRAIELVRVVRRVVPSIDGRQRGAWRQVVRAHNLALPAIGGGGGARGGRGDTIKAKTTIGKRRVQPSVQSRSSHGQRRGACRVHAASRRYSRRAFGGYNTGKQQQRTERKSRGAARTARSAGCPGHGLTDPQRRRRYGRRTQSRRRRV